MTNYTPAQLEAWAGLGPWRALGTDPAEGVDCFWIKGQPNPAMRGFSDEIAAANGSQNDPKRQTIAAALAAAPDLARLVLERDAEIARLRASMAAKQWPPSDAELREMLAVIVGAWWSESSAFVLRTRQLNPEDIKGMYAIRDVLAPYIARQAMKETSDE